MPLLPERLAYPEIIPEAFHNDVLYRDHNEFIKKLCFVISNYSQFREKIEALSQAMGRFAWENMIDRYDDELEKLAVLRSNETVSG
jgi:glycosyltransferase involved in cell wall biosynthesis